MCTLKFTAWLRCGGKRIPAACTALIWVIFALHSVTAARCASFFWNEFPANRDATLTENSFRTDSGKRRSYGTGGIKKRREESTPERLPSRALDRQ